MPKLPRPLKAQAPQTPTVEVLVDFREEVSFDNLLAVLLADERR